MQIPIFQRAPEQLSEANPSVEPKLQSPRSSEPQQLPPRRRITTQQFERNVRTRQSISSALPDSSSEAALAFSACGLEPACVSKKQWKKLVLKRATCDCGKCSENLEDDWLATASFRAHARVEVNVRKTIF